MMIIKDAASKNPRPPHTMITATSANIRRGSHANHTIDRCVRQESIFNAIQYQNIPMATTNTILSKEAGK
jgi:hypothetical protein